MIRNLRKLCHKKKLTSTVLQKRYFLTNDYKCTETWNIITSSPPINKINLNDFYNQLDQRYSSKGTISAIDIDLFANAVKDPVHLEELKELLHKLRLSAETGNMLESTSHATVRKFMQFGYIHELIEILKDPLNFGVFLDNYSANILLNELLVQQNYELAADVAVLVMLQEEFTNDITCTLCQYACYKYILQYTPPEPSPPEEKSKKVEEIKIRIKFLRNPYFDDHFDIKDKILQSGKTLAWISEGYNNNLNYNLQIIGWVMYKKIDKLLALCEQLATLKSFKLFGEVIELLNKEQNNVEPEIKEVLEKCISILGAVEQTPTEISLEKSLTIAIENAINKSQNTDISEQQKLFSSWEKIREEKLQEQTKRLDRARRTQLMQVKQKEMQEEEQKLWFFENEDHIDLEIEEKEKLIDNTVSKKKALKTTDENYIPPEIIRKRK